MRRLIVATLILMLAVGLPATASADDSSGDGDEQGSATPQLPPSDAVALTVDAEPYEARIDDLYEVDWYRFTAVGGRDYWIVADTHRGGSRDDVDITVSLHDAGGVELDVRARTGYDDLEWVLLTDARATTYFVRVFVSESAFDPTGNYGLEIRTIDDDHGNTAEAGTLVHPGSAITTEYAGRIDYEDDEDWLIFDARAGDIYRVSPARPWVGLRVYAIDPTSSAVQVRLTEWRTFGDHEDGLGGGIWRIEESGRYAVSLRDYPNIDDYPYEYTATFEKLTDDHSNLPDDPSPLRVDRRTTATLNYDDDEDWFSVDLIEGEAYLVEISSGEPTPPGAWVRLYGLGSSEYQDNYTLSRSELINPRRSQRLWKATGTGSHLLGVSTRNVWSSSYPAEYSVLISRRPADDHADGSEGSTVIRPGAWLEATLDVVGDEDWFRFSARPGIVYAVEFGVRGEGAEEYVPLSEYRHSVDVTAYFLDDNWGFDADTGYVYAAEGTQYLLFTADRFSRLESIDYRFRLVEYESIDYGDDRSTARALESGETVIGSASGQDADWFAFDAQAGGIYSITSGSGESLVSVFDDTEEVPTVNSRFGYPGETWSNRGLEFWTAPTAGQYWIRLSGKWAEPDIYHLGLTYTPASEDDHGDTAEEATEVVLAPDPDGPLVESLDPAADSTVEIGRRKGRLENFLDEDWFALRLQRGVKYRITTRAPDPDSYTPSMTFNENVRFSFREGETFTDDRESRNPTIDLLPTVTGMYYLTVSRAGGQPSLEPLAYSFEVEILAPDDVPDLRENAPIVSAGTTLEGTLDTPGDLDWYRFDALEGQTWILQADTDSFGCARVYGPEEPKPFIEQCREERVVWVAPADGEYGLRLSPLRVWNWHKRTPFDYRLTLSPADPDDYGNSAWDTSTLIAGEERSGRMDYVGDRDVFRLTVAEGEIWKLDVSLSRYGMTYDARFVAVGADVDPSGVVSRYAHDGFLAAPVDGAWLITVTSDRRQGTYSLVAEKLDVTDDYGNDRDHAHLLATPSVPDPGCVGCSNTTSVEGTLDYDADSDYFRVTLEAGTNYEISVHSESEQVIFALLTEKFCARWGPTVWERTVDNWVPKRTADYWVRVGLGRFEGGEPADYTLEVTAHRDEFLTPEEQATQLESNVVHEVAGDESTGSDLYRVTVANSRRHVIEVTGVGFEAGGISPSEQFGEIWWEDESRYLTPLPSNPPPVYFFGVWGPAGQPYTVVVRDRVPSDNDLDWNQMHISPAFEPDYCYRAGDEWWR